MKASPLTEPEKFTVTPDQADRRLDRVLRGLFPDVPLSAIMGAIRRGKVRVSGAKRDGAARLEAGDVVLTPWRLKTAAKTDRALTAKSGKNAGKLRTVLRTDSIWCIDKPVDLLSQPDERGGDSVITRAWAELAWDRDDFRPALIGRLDRNVSGVMMMALDAPTLRILSGMMRDGLIKKIYRAVVLGRPEEYGEVDIPLVKDAGRNVVAAAEARGGQSALTRYRVLDAGGGFSLVELELVTGRPHQARVHMSAIGHPIAGDFKYGDRNQDRAKIGIFLHAYSLSLPNLPDLPGNLRDIAAIAPLPERFHVILQSK